MKRNIGYLGLLGIPLALLGVVSSVAVAAPKTIPAVAPIVVGTAAQVTDTDSETNDDASVSTNVSKDTVDCDIETNDDASSAQEAPGIEQAD